MRRQLYVLAVAAAVAIGAAPSALSGTPTFVSSPKEGPAPQNISVSGGDCFAESGAEQVVVTLQVTPPVQVTINVSNEPDFGDWAGVITVPAGTPPGTYQIDAQCNYNQQNGNGPDLQSHLGGFHYAPNFYTVLAPPPSPSPLVTPTPTPTEEPEEEEVAEAQPARAVRGQPTFTG